MTDIRYVVGLADIATQFGVPVTTAGGWCRRPDFPAPAARIQSGGLWDLRDVVRWFASYVPLHSANGTAPDPEVWAARDLAAAPQRPVNARERAIADSVPCPESWCAAGVGELCLDRRYRSRRLRIARPHNSRAAAWTEGVGGSAARL